MKFKTGSGSEWVVPGTVRGKRGFIVKIYPVNSNKKLPTLAFNPRPQTSTSTTTTLSSSSSTLSFKGKDGFKLEDPSSSSSSSSSSCGPIQVGKKRTIPTAPTDDSKPKTKRFKSSSQSTCQPKSTSANTTYSISKQTLNDQKVLFKQEGSESKSQSPKKVGLPLPPPPPPAAAPTMKEIISNAMKKLREVEEQRNRLKQPPQTKRIQQVEWIVDRQQFKLMILEIERRAFTRPLFQDNVKAIRDLHKLMIKSS